MTDKTVLKNFTIEELLEEAATRQEADEWVEQPFGETTNDVISSLRQHLTSLAICARLVNVAGKFCH